MVECSIIFFSSVDIHTHTHTHIIRHIRKKTKDIYFDYMAKIHVQFVFFIRFHFWNIDLCWKLVQIVIYLVTSVPFRSTCIHIYINRCYCYSLWKTETNRKMVHETKSNDLCVFFLFSLRSSLATTLKIPWMLARIFVSRNIVC